jgi:hypothetical protein
MITTYVLNINPFLCTHNVKFFLKNPFVLAYISPFTNPKDAYPSAL